MTFRDLKTAMISLPLHDLAETPVESVGANAGALVLEVTNRHDKRALKDIRDGLIEVRDQCESLVDIIDALLKP